ncbi:MAG: DUF560 domain-containing protein [Sphingomonadales bacterium]|nr:DUF560 domain-containing protein [Sphingomonadales bacterium]
MAQEAQPTAPGQEQPQAQPQPPALSLSAADLFLFADRARDAGDLATAETAYRALSTNPDIELRTEARFRLAMMLADRQHKYREAAVQLRAILDEKPRASRVRLELARMQALMGNLGSAERELRAAEAAGLPPDVQRMVRFYANALGAAKSFGGSIEVSLAPDSNINRATRSDTLGTVIGDFTLDPNARAKSGVGLDLRGQAWLRHGIDKRSSLMVRLSGSADLYRDHAFDDYVLGLQAGPEYASGRDRISLSAGPAWRWYGTDPYTFTFGVNGAWQHPMGGKTQLRLDGGAARVNNLRNDLQDAVLWTASAALDRAFSARSGGGVQAFASREAARDPGYATASGGANVYAFRELGKTTAVLSAGYSHLEADARLFLYPRRRVEDRFTASLAGTFRALQVAGFAPVVRLRWERNRSTIEIYDYHRVAGELGLTAAF